MVIHDMRNPTSSIEFGLNQIFKDVKEKVATKKKEDAMKLKDLKK